MRASRGWRHSRLEAAIAAMLATAMLLLGPGASVAHAAPVATQELLRAEASADPVERPHGALDRREIARELERLGVDPVEAQRRVDALSAAELAALQGRLDQLPAGASSLGVVVGAALLVFLVLLFTDIAGLTDVFPFVKKPAAR